MLFPTLPFAVFFLAVFATAWAAVRDNEWRKLLLLLASWLFYGAWDFRFVALLIASAFGNWLLARLIASAEEEGRRKLLVGLGVAANLVILGWFKYYDFFLEQAAQMLSAFGAVRDVPLVQVLLPVGVSFFTFQGISYLVDVHRRKVEPAHLLDVTLLMSFFPHLVAGPIVRAADLLPQLRAPARLDRGEAAAGVLLVVWGLFKKVVIASPLSTGLVDPVFADPGAFTSLDLLIAVYGYAAQIYCDFSAYSDMAIGLAALLGYRFQPNFDQPYRAASLQDFWRRWHISLSSWLRDYLYIPLGGSRGGVAVQCRNLVITMVLGGLWHGASTRFLIWGALHGSWLSAERLWAGVRPQRWPRAPAVVGILVTFHVVCLGWVFFRAPSFGDALGFLGRMAAGAGGPTHVTPLCAALLAVGIGLCALPRDALPRAARALARLPAPAAGLVAASLILLIDAAHPDGVAPFIYYQF